MTSSRLTCRVIIFTLATLFTTQVRSQSIAPEVQFWVDSIQRWINATVAENGKLDSAHLAALNNKAKSVQDSVEKAKATNTTSTGGGLKSKVVTKTIMAGGSLVVPTNTIWKLKGVYIKNDKDPYRLKVTSFKYEDIYKPGEKINFPLVSSESALMDEGEGTELTYEVEIEEIILK